MALTASGTLEQRGSGDNSLQVTGEEVGPDHDALLETPQRDPAGKGMSLHTCHRLSRSGGWVITTPCFVFTPVFLLFTFPKGENDPEVTTRIFAAFEFSKLSNLLVLDRSQRAVFSLCRTDFGELCFCCTRSILGRGFIASAIVIAVYSSTQCRDSQAATPRNLV